MTGNFGSPARVASGIGGNGVLLDSRLVSRPREYTCTALVPLMVTRYCPCLHLEGRAGLAVVQRDIEQAPVFRERAQRTLLRYAHRYGQRLAGALGHRQRGTQVHRQRAHHHA